MAPSSLFGGKHGLYSIQDPSLNSSAVEALARLLEEQSFRLAVVAVPQGESTATGWRKDMRRHLVSDGKLLAVIGGLGTKKTDKQVQYWIVCGEPRPTKGVLFIDLSLLAQEEDADVANMMAFAARIVCILHPSVEDGLFPPFESERYLGLLSRHFQSGYQDVQGLCHVIGPRRIEAADWSLDLAYYVARPADANPVHKRLDGRLVMDLLRRASAPLRVYVIGVNGQGKSLLLAQIAEELAERDIHSVGLSFGLTDRFVFGTHAQTTGKFRYIGARTAESVISLGATKRRLEEHVRTIVSDSKRLQAFQSALATLGFGHRLYLIPSTLKVREGLIPDDRLAEIVEVTESRTRDASLEMPATFSLAVLVEERGHHIVPFENLSSGEQHLITLAAKLSACGGPGTVMLVDEPELSLHVSWQRAIPLMLAGLSQQLGCAMVIATHSPVLIASALAEDHCFVAERQILKGLSRSKFASVESVLLDDFGTYTSNTRRVHELCAMVVADTIRELNDDMEKPSQRHRQLALGRLNDMTRVIQAAQTGNLECRDRDLELIRQTHAAIEELFQQQTMVADHQEGQV